MSKLMAVLFFGAAAVRVWFDWQATISQADPFRFAQTGAVWAEIHAASFEAFQPTMEQNNELGILDSAISQVLMTPLAPILFGLSLVFWFLGRRKKS